MNVTKLLERASEAQKAVQDNKMAWANMVLDDIIKDLREQCAVNTAKSNGQKARHLAALRVFKRAVATNHEQIAKAFFDDDGRQILCDSVMAVRLDNAIDTIECTDNKDLARSLNKNFFDYGEGDEVITLTTADLRCIIAEKKEMDGKRVTMQVYGKRFDTALVKDTLDLLGGEMEVFVDSRGIMHANGQYGEGIVLPLRDIK